MPVEILYQDRFLIACVKPAGVVSEDDGMPALLQEQLDIPHAYCVHRLDQAVGGVMIYARDEKTAATMTGKFSGHDVAKTYLAVVSGTPNPPTGEMHDLLFHDTHKNKTYIVTRSRRGVKEAALEYESLDCIPQQNETLSLVRIHLLTGRSHQIRAQFASRKMPLVGDGKYGSTVKNRGIALWSYQISFAHPANGKPLRFSAQPPQTTPWNCFFQKGTDTI